MNGAKLLNRWRGRGLRYATAPTVGRAAYPRWWERLRALAGLAVLNVALGLLVAAGFGLVLLLVGVAIEFAISS